MLFGGRGDVLIEALHKRVEVSVGNCYVEAMSLLINEGLYESHAEIVKDALRRLFTHYEIHLISDDSPKL